MAKYRKKPVVIEARRLGEDTHSQRSIAIWVGSTARFPETEPCLYLETLEGIMRADVGDWIIKGVQGEFYPCKPDIFEATYEPVE